MDGEAYIQALKNQRNGAFSAAMDEAATLAAQLFTANRRIAELEAENETPKAKKKGGTK